MKKSFIIHPHAIEKSNREADIAVLDKIREITISAKNRLNINGELLSQFAFHPDVLNITQSRDFCGDLSRYLRSSLLPLMLYSPEIEEMRTNEYEQLASICLGFAEDIGLEYQIALANVAAKLYPARDLIVLGNIAPPYVAVFIQREDEVEFSGAYREMCVESCAQVARKIGAETTVLESASALYDRATKFSSI